MITRNSALRRISGSRCGRTSLRSMLTAVVVLSGLHAHGLPAQQEVDLQGDHQEASKQAVQRMAECARIERQFNQYDLYRSASSSKTYGVDVRGRVWTINRNPTKGCSLQTKHRLNRPEYEIDYSGRRLWSTFYYENKQLCLYSREHDQKIFRKCYQPVGIINRLAPYFLN